MSPRDSVNAALQDPSGCLEYLFSPTVNFDSDVARAEVIIELGKKERRTLIALPGVEMDALLGIKKTLEEQGFEVEIKKIKGTVKTVEEWREDERKKKKAAIEGLRTLFE